MILKFLEYKEEQKFISKMDFESEILSGILRVRSNKVNVLLLLSSNNL